MDIVVRVVLMIISDAFDGLQVLFNTGIVVAQFFLNIVYNPFIIVGNAVQEA